MERGAYRERAESFLSALGAEYYDHYSGLKADYGVEEIYRRHDGLFSAEAVLAIHEQWRSDDPDSGESRRLRMLLEFAIDGHLGNVTRDLDAELAGREAVLTVTAGGNTLPFRAASVAQANEPDRERRGELEQARLELTERALNPLYREWLERVREATRALGWDSYCAMYAEAKGVDFAALERETATFLADTSDDYPELLDPELRRAVGMRFADLRRADLPRFFRAADLDDAFPSERLLPALADTLVVAGIELQTQPGVLLDLEPRPTKSPRPFCSPVRVPGDVRLMMAPTGGRHDYQALMHEAGHTEHYAHVNASHPMEFRWLGDNAITECYAFLLAGLVDDPDWLERRLAVSPERAAEIARRGRVERLLYLRRYAGKLAYELELHSGATKGADLAAVYAATLGGAVGIDWPREPYLSDVDPGFYSSCYLRAWALEAHVRMQLRTSYGADWFEHRGAWDELRALWSEGQRSTPTELLQRLTGRDRLDFGVLIGDLCL